MKLSLSLLFVATLCAAATPTIAADQPIIIDGCTVVETVIKVETVNDDTGRRSSATAARR